MKILPTFILITFMSAYTLADTNTIVKEIPNTHKGADAYPGVEWKPKTDLNKDLNKYPGVEWKPKSGDPKPEKNPNAYPGVEWTPKR